MESMESLESMESMETKGSMESIQGIHGIHGIQGIHGMHGVHGKPARQPSFVGPGVGVGVVVGREGCQHLGAEREVFWGEVLGSGSV